MLEDAFVTHARPRVRPRARPRRAETANLARYPAQCQIVFPAILLLVLGRQFERGEPDRLLAGFAATALLTVAFFQFGVGIATSRTTPWEAYLRTLPAAPTTRLVGRVLAALVFATATVSTVALVAFTVYRVDMPAWRLGALALASLLLALGGAPAQDQLAIKGGRIVPVGQPPIDGFLWMRLDERVPHDVDVASQPRREAGWRSSTRSRLGRSRTVLTSQAPGWAGSSSPGSATGDEGERFS
jgi:hypothetical protein